MQHQHSASDNSDDYEEWESLLLPDVGNDVTEREEEKEKEEVANSWPSVNYKSLSKNERLNELDDTESATPAQEEAPSDGESPVADAKDAERHCHHQTSSEKEATEENEFLSLLRKVHVRQVDWRLVPGVVCVLSVALLGITHYVYVRQAANYYTKLQNLTSRRSVDRTNKRDVCQWRNGTFVDYLLASSNPVESELNKFNQPSCSKLELSCAENAERNAHLRRVVGELKSNVARLERERKILRNALVSLDEREDKLSKREPDVTSTRLNVDENRLFTPQMLDHAAVTLAGVATRLRNCLNAGSSPPAECATLGKKTLKRLRKLAQSIGEIASSIESTIEKRSPSAVKASPSSPKRSSKKEKASSKSVFSKVDRSVGSSGIKKKSGNSGRLTLKSGPDSDWFFNAYEQREALRGEREKDISQDSMSLWLIRRWNKRASLRRNRAHV